jgi:hypothetical protein
MTEKCDLLEKTSNCAPGIKERDGFCFSDNDLIEIAKNYNLFYNETIDLTLPRRDLLNLLVEKTQEKFRCGSGSCWLQQKFMKGVSKEIKRKYKPQGPLDDKWLNTLDINNIMDRYTHVYSDFKWLGAVPLDFEELDLYSEVDFRNLNKLGLVINFDPHTKKGKHWVALYAELKNNKIFYFDSYGGRPEQREIRDFIKRLKKYCSDRDRVDYRYNKIRHQFKHSECGVYSVNFIIRLLGGESFKSITENITKDSAMQSCRKTYFNT